MTSTDTTAPAGDNTAFASLPLTTEFLANLDSLGYKEMTTIQADLGMPRHSAAGVNMASVRQYSQKPIMNRAKRAPDSNMAEA